ncbi:hypothetical protein QJS04_geneDACA021539 [Acorus gramineus]|uniref:Heat shock factor binding protein n=2 Tax=Acorus TaxID=4464 RepID=A0AAV9F7T7_ACOCL|nr:hypothetical protein QJS04_geneDACA021539 [Acorus gramineus]KAK1321941.1 hypothetical protein QJS10_CPA03g01593 [Acorus calamus]
MDGHEPEDAKQSTADMTTFVQNLLQQMQSRFQGMSEKILTKIDEMGSRIDELERSINDLKAEVGPESSPSPLAPSKVVATDESKAEGSA